MDIELAQALEEIAELRKQNTNLQIMLQAEREVRCNKEYLKKVTELEAQIEQLTFLHNEDVNTIKLLNKQKEKMKCCGNCKHRYFIGDELECHLLDRGINCDNEEKWELAD